MNAPCWLLLVLFATAAAVPSQPKLEEILRDLQSEDEAKVAWAAYHAATRKQRAAIPAIRKALHGSQNVPLGTPCRQWVLGSKGFCGLLPSRFIVFPS